MASFRLDHNSILRLCSIATRIELGARVLLLSSVAHPRVDFVTTSCTLSSAITAGYPWWFAQPTRLLPLPRYDVLNSVRAPSVELTSYTYRDFAYSTRSGCSVVVMRVRLIKQGSLGGLVQVYYRAFLKPSALLRQVGRVGDDMEQVRWRSWLSHLSNTQKVPSSSLGRITE